jgi:hypothetical protein
MLGFSRQLSAVSYPLVFSITAAAWMGSPEPTRQPARESITQTDH